MSYGGEDPPTRCLRFFREIDRKGGRASKWGLIKIAGNEAQFDRWVKNLLLYHKFLNEIKEGRYTFYEKTERGQIFHNTLKDRHIVIAYKRLSGKRLKRETQVRRP